MTYHALGAEEGFDWQGVAEDCAAGAKVDWSTKAGREAGTKSTASCAAEAACAYFTGGASAAAGGLCGAIGGEVAGFVIDAWNSVFGDDDAERKERERLRQNAAWLATSQQIYELDKLLNQSAADAAKRLVVAHDKILPGRKGELTYVGAWKLLGKMGGPIVTSPKTGQPTSESFYGDYMTLLETHKPASVVVQDWVKLVTNVVTLKLMPNLAKAEDKARAVIVAKKAQHEALKGAAEEGAVIAVARKERQRVLGAALLIAGAAGAAWIIYRRRR